MSQDPPSTGSLPRKAMAIGFSGEVLETLELLLDILGWKLDTSADYRVTLGNTNLIFIDGLLITEYELRSVISKNITDSTLVVVGFRGDRLLRQTIKSGRVVWLDVPISVVEVENILENMPL